MFPLRADIQAGQRFESTHARVRRAPPRPLVRLGIGKEEDAPLAAAERTDIYEDLG